MLNSKKKLDPVKIYEQADQIAYTKAIRSFSDDVKHNEPSHIDNGFNDGEITAYVKAINEFDVSDLDAASDKIIDQYQKAEAEAYQKALKSFNAPVQANPLTDHPNFSKGEEDAIRNYHLYAKAYSEGQKAAYEKAFKAFNETVHPVGYKPQPIKGFLKNIPEALFVAKMMQTRDSATKGMYIYSNWITIYALTKRMWETGTEMTWDSFKNFATDMSVFVEEVMEDMPKGSTQVTQIPDLLREIIDLWPPLKMIAGGARIVYDEEDDAQENPLDKRFESVTVPGRKMEVLADVNSKAPDGNFIYTDEDMRAVEEVKLKFKAIFRVILDMKGEIQKRSELYDSLLRLRQGLDKLQDVFDPKKLDKMTDLSNIDLGVVESIKQQLKDIYSNRYLDPQIAGLIKKIDDKIDMDTWFFKANSNTGDPLDRNPLHKLRRGVNRVILRLNGSQIMEGLRAANAYYDQIWAAIHKGRQLVAPTRP